MKRKLKLSHGRTVLETIIILSMVGILISVAINRFMKNVVAARETLLRSELTNIRTSIMLYHIVNGKYPDNLAELAEGKYLKAYSEDTVISGDYLKPNAVAKDGTPLDPFGRRYGYNRESGEIKSLTKGYESW